MGLVRQKQIERLQTEKFDLLVIGGGAIGAGIAFDATLRGLSVALVDAKDFGAEASSHSTKLLHGGVRYLERAVKHLDYEQLRLVRTALREKRIVFRIAPHLTRQIELVIPVTDWAHGLYCGAGLKMYDWLSGGGGTGWRSASQVEALFPKLGPVKGGIRYVDGQFDDTRLNLSVMLSAERLGACIANYVEVRDLIKVGNQLSGAQLFDYIGNQEFSLQAKKIVNATGARVDLIRQMEQEECQPLIIGSRGTHLVLDQSFSGERSGVLIPKTRDGRLIFLLPWQGKTLLGTTDTQMDPVENPLPTDDDKKFLLEHVNEVLKEPIGDSEVLAQWSGMRALVRKRGAWKTGELSRGHQLEVGPMGLVSIAGGKWTIYRQIAEEVVDLVAPNTCCVTSQTALFDAVAPSRANLEALSETSGLSQNILSYLMRTYGSSAQEVMTLVEKGYDTPLHPDYPYLEAEVIYGVISEYAVKPEDVLSRRLHLSLQDERAAQLVLERIRVLIAKGECHPHP